MLYNSPETSIKRRPGHMIGQVNVRLIYLMLEEKETGNSYRRKNE